MTFAVYHICADLHSRTNMYEIDAKYYLWRLYRLKQFGFDPGTLPIMQMQADSRALRALADAIDLRCNELTKQTELK